MKKIFLILTDIGFSKRDYDRFGINQLKKEFEVKVLDFTKLFSLYFWKNYKEKIFYFKGYKRVSNEKDLKLIFSEKRIVVALDFLSSLTRANSVRKLVKNYRIPLALIFNGSVMPLKRTFIENIFVIYFYLFNPQKLIKKLLSFNLRSRSVQSVNYDYALVSGRADLQSKLIHKDTKIIKAHSFDFEEVIKIKKKNIFKRRPYVVFLDQFVPYHSGAKFRGEKNKCTVENYYPAINSFFDNFEKKFRTQIIIAGHPRSNYILNKKIWNGRKCYLNKTIELVKYSEMVMTHTSTAISYAVIFNKKIIFLTTNEYMKSYDNFRPNSYARQLDSVIINLDKVNDFNLLPEKSCWHDYNKRVYNDYKKNYISFNVNNKKSLWQIFSKKIIIK